MANTICIPENSGGLGGVAGGAGAQGQASQDATGAAARGYGYPTIEIVTGMTADLEVQLTKDYNGEIASDMSNIGKVVFKARPTMRHGNYREISVPCTFTEDGKVSFTLTPKQVNYNEGVWYAEFLAYDNAGKLRHNYRAYLCIRKGMTGSKAGPQPVTPMDVRLAVMDTSPEMNTLLDDLEFSDVMIMNAVERAIDEWEETPPRLSKHFDATNFPFREHLIKGAVGYLLQSVMYRYMRNEMHYSASGLTFDKNSKHAYLQLSQMARTEWKNFIAAMKTSMNMEEVTQIVEQPWFDSTWGWDWFY